MINDHKIIRDVMVDWIGFGGVAIDKRSEQAVFSVESGE
ncbi:hypothetical protein FOQG_07977 [Fusarium oxysporum f. sp. raphani 54005]|jgi:hypothetical protein|uniref:Uncharacterized protein n=6 Tax=Fusarium oxysporum TaxID=5507 RepID=W9IHU9_FUSOX|nr:hypothetical protein FOXG_17822 [Fusarium oxysporum f. sp. lycopersici 4287]EWY94503.1 hypothetical protein FOYG_07201 [Fusarium oxysporum NRRL 32931]EWZ50185.1 hypothetical protein FOZG_00831 [Fusarium oxysporum Fo47]EXK89356.1 hypothetical protein FOQG_07977 [Fusarium oxysporum f. sp. raphani 54005]EXL49146.1 hypothetical protein FOCG_09631 [Fusarium oxysporum f. sp. radicis-lycopersici 26381]EXL83810.1 hypothetical protein FOPG_03825 [Fusarium oxysporum f. sp. conglutinans race 2 54008]